MSRGVVVRFTIYGYVQDYKSKLQMISTGTCQLSFILPLSTLSEYANVALHEMYCGSVVDIYFRINHSPATFHKTYHQCTPPFGDHLTSYIVGVSLISQ